MVTLRSVVQLSPLLFSACLLVSLVTWSNDDISTYKVTCKRSGDWTLVVRTRSGDDHHLLITELRSGAGNPEAEGQEAGAQATGNTTPEATERRVISIHPHRWTTSEAVKTHFYYRTDFPSADRLKHPDDIRFIFNQWLSSRYFGSESHEELVAMNRARRRHQRLLFADLTCCPDFTLGVMPSLNVLNRLALIPTTSETPKLELLLPIPPITFPPLSLTGSPIITFAPSILRPVVETNDGVAFTVHGVAESDCGYRCDNPERPRRVLFNSVPAALSIAPNLAQQNKQPVTAYFTYHPENDRVQLDRLEMGKYLTITHTSSGETDSQDEFVTPLLSRWEEYLKQKERLSFKGEAYLKLCLKHKQKLNKRCDSIIKKEQKKPSKNLKRYNSEELSKVDIIEDGAKEDAAEDLLKPHGKEHEFYVSYKMYKLEQDSPNSHSQTEAEQPLTEVSQDTRPASHENGAVSTNNSAPSTADSSSLTGEPLSRSTLLLPSFNSESQPK